MIQPNYLFAFQALQAFFANPEKVASNCAINAAILILTAPNVSQMRQGTPLVTIGIPTYNRADSYLKPTLESALAQSYPNLEIIVADNCSGDKTGEAVKAYRDRRIRYHRHDPPVKPPKNADFCLDQARGEYFLLLHDDDLIDSDFVKTCVAALVECKAAFARTGARTIDANGKIRKIRPNPQGPRATLFEFYDAILRGQAVTYFCNTLYRTSLLKAVGGFQSPTFTYNDVITNIKLAHRHGWVNLPEPMASYRVHDSKLGIAADIGRWCDDSLAIIELMRELMPEHEAYFKGDGMKLMCRRNFAKAGGVLKMPMTLRGYAIIAKKYRCRPFALKLFITSSLRHISLPGSITNRRARQRPKPLTN